MTRWFAAGAAAGAALLAAVSASGDGGLLRLNQVVGDVQIAVFTAPTPLRVGTVDVSVMVQRAAAQTPVLDAEVEIVLRSGGVARAAAATHAAATNKLLYVALIEVPAAGRWEIAARVRSGGVEATVATEVDVAPPLGAAWDHWPYLVLPALVIALFAIHQTLKMLARQQA